MKKLLVALVAVLLMVTSVYFINKEGAFDVRCFIEENEVEMCFDDSLWHYNYWLERKQDLHGDKTVIGKQSTSNTAPQFKLALAIA